MILDRIVVATKIRVEKVKEKISLQQMMTLAKKSNTPFAFEKALRQKDVSFICEVKKASPSKGIITDDFPYIQIAKEYESAGAAAISVLTEPDFFMGKTDYLKSIKQNVTIPVLQKDFIIDEYQIYEASSIGADAVLLICSVLSKNKVIKFIEIADGLGLSCLVETHDEQEIITAINAGARIIGVNNRNLKTFDVDLNNSVRLRKFVPQNIIFVSESGIKTAEDVKRLHENGTDAVLIGETLMKSKNKKGVLSNLRGEHNG
ncbi:MAG: indole-3-glycerol phosphate synthase [Clostridiales bacterium GWF2_38_85]|nr:MAG: indole-3-glycerol phosphate synthase [Clostridiales bacterium GWF2_38_85]HBL84986.1 indole-3-glycerol phosphate synthase TrpC [Clostridiales bacterium]